MVKVKLNSFSEKTTDFPQYEDERLSEIFERFYESLNLGTDSHKESFKIYLNGEEIEKELWAYIKPKPDAVVLISLFPKSGDTGRVLGQIVVAVATIAYASQPWIAATIAIVGNLAVNQLFPPPALDLGDINVSRNQEDSQMYTIRNQSNQQKKYGIVPKVYGRHRIYPNVAAVPYTEFEVVDGELIQYFYAIYDLGYGPMEVSDVKIGETDIELFEDAFYRLVDLNKPIPGEGSWDNALDNNFHFYKGDNNVESVAAAINVNQIDTGAVPDDYTVIRNADENPNGYVQEIILEFGFQQGLITYASNGSRAERAVELNVEFAEVGTENWKPFNDASVASNFQAIGDLVDATTNKMTLAFQNRANAFERYFPLFDLLGSVEITKQERYLYPIESSGFLSSDYNDEYYMDRYGYKAGTKFIYATSAANVGDYILYGNRTVGRIKAITVHSGDILKYELYEGLPQDFYIFRDFTRLDDGGSPYLSYYIDVFGSDHPPLPFNYFRIAKNTFGSFTIRGEATKPVYASVRFTPHTRNQIKVRVVRYRSYGGHTYRIVDEMAWGILTTRLWTDPIVTNQRHVFMEVKIKATDQLNGTVNNLSAVGHSVLDVYNGTSWVKQATSNPAWAFADILTGAINKRAINKTRLDTDSLLEWASFCDAIPTPPPGGTYERKRFESNFVCDTAITINQLLNQITSSSQASINIINGKYGVLVDKLKTIPVQVFTPRNSWNFSSSRAYSNLPHAIKVKYIDPAREWGLYEELVYADGYDELNATEFDEINTFGCTNFEQAWRLGRYYLTSSILRQENISIDVDFEHLVCTRGDYVKLQHDVMKVGGRPARVNSVAGSVITIDDAFITEIGKSYGYTFRDETGIYSGTMTITDSETATLDNDIPSVGDLLIWGEVDNITIDCLIKSITPKDDMTANIILIEKADEVYTAESTSTLPIYDPQLVEAIDANTQAPPPVENLTIDNSTWRCNAGDYQYYVTLSWQVPTGAIIDKYEIYVDSGDGYELIDYSTGPYYEYIVNSNNVGVEHKFKIIGVAANGSKLTLSEVTEITNTPLSKTTAPSDVEALFINILNESLQLDWDVVADCDIDHYLIRYSPNLNASWSSSIPLQVVDANTSLAQFQARVGAYFIKAVDWNGNESTNAASAVTSIPALININVIEETNDFPALLGEKDKVETFGTELVLQQTVAGPPPEYESEGYYYYDELLDLGEIYTVRLQSLIEAEGFSTEDLMVNWTTLADVDLLSSSIVSDWSVETEYRSTDNLNVMAEWTTLDAIDPISVGISEDWTNWRKFTIGDFTGRIFQFRLKLISNTPNITPRVFDGIIKSDMPDRVENYDNITTVAGTANITYVPSFKGPGTTPNIQITQDNAQQGDYYQITNKTLDGFTIKFYDKNDVLVDRQFDALVKGYGRKQTQVI